MAKTNYIRKELSGWYQENKRDLPWRKTQDPYVIWVSEVMLQQTRVEHGLPYFRAFINQYPTVEDLAQACEDEVMKLWEGLGYYNRARHMMTSARKIVEEFDGKFPDNYNDLLQLKGVGPYTAAAIASFAFQEPQPVVDGNVYRVLARYFGVSTPIDSTDGQKKFKEIAHDVLDKTNPGEHNQAIMEFGALQCVNRSPDCNECPVAEKCAAYQADKVHHYPVKEKTIEHQHRFFNYLVIEHDGQYFVRKRTEKDIWRNLYEFPLIESNRLLNEEELVAQEEWQALLPDTNYQIKGNSVPYKQTLSHQKIHGVFWEVSVQGPPQPQGQEWVAASPSELDNYAFPRIIICYLDTKILSLPLK